MSHSSGSEIHSDLFRLARWFCSFQIEEAILYVCYPATFADTRVIKIFRAAKWIPLALATFLSACGPPTYFVIQGYPDAPRPLTETFTVKSTNYSMRLVKVDGKKGHYIPVRGGPAAYAGFDLKLLPGRHQLTAFCWDYMVVSERISAGMTIDVEGKAGESYDAGCVSDGNQVHLEVHRSPSS